jgi:hypothetical protein
VGFSYIKDSLAHFNNLSRFLEVKYLYTENKQGKFTTWSVLIIRHFRNFSHIARHKLKSQQWTLIIIISELWQNALYEANITKVQTSNPNKLYITLHHGHDINLALQKTKPHVMNEIGQMEPMSLSKSVKRPTTLCLNKRLNKVFPVSPKPTTRQAYNHTLI